MVAWVYGLPTFPAGLVIGSAAGVAGFIGMILLESPFMAFGLQPSEVLSGAIGCGLGCFLGNTVFTWFAWRR